MTILSAQMAWEPYTPTAEEPWTLTKVGHLYRRAGFGATHAELTRGLTNGPAATIRELLDGTPADADFEKTSDYMARERSMPAGASGATLAAWWLHRMLRTSHPLLEKMTLFWHNHFATSLAKVQNARYMLGQYRVLSTHALGHFPAMLQAMSFDPAMMVWLDTTASKRGKANENYARELMELFSLGIGHYTEADIREAAKAFTGYTIANGTMEFVGKEHDTTTKKVFGKSGNFNGPDIVKLCLNQPACSQFLVRKLYRYLVSDTDNPTEEFLAPLVTLYRDSDYDTAKLVETIIRSRHFFSAAVYRTRVKSPIDFAVGMVRAIEGNVGPLNLATALESLGQVLFAPPSVKGWDGGTTWLNGQTLLYRQNLALALTSTDDLRFGRRSDPVAVLAKYAKVDDATAVDFYLKLFLQNDAPPTARTQLLAYIEDAKKTMSPAIWSASDVLHHRIRTIARLVLALPEYQLD